MSYFALGLALFAGLILLGMVLAKGKPRRIRPVS